MQNFKDHIKNSNLLAYVYKLFFLIVFFCFDHILKKRKKIIFTSFSGRQYSDSPKIIFESMKKDDRFKDFEFVWAFNSPKKYEDLDCKKVNINKIQFIIELFSSSVWISNTSIEKLIPYKSNQIFYLNTWHGIPLKKIGKDELQVGHLIKQWYNNVEFDALTTCSEYDEEIFKRVFPKSKKYLRTGLPRNASLIINDEDKEKIREKFFCKHQIDKDTRIILYAPTFREYNPTIENPLYKQETFSEIKENTLILLRTHYFEKIEMIHPNVLNVSDESLEELMIVSDCLITDYSSLMFDYYLLNKPIYMYAYDYDEYKNIRGLYIDLKEKYKIPILDSNDLSAVFIEDDKDKQLNTFLKSINFKTTVDMEQILELIYNNLESS